MYDKCGNGPRPGEAPSFHEGDGGSNPPCRIQLRLCKDADEFAMFRHMIDAYHTYKSWKPSPGRKICWLIENEDSDVIGSIAVHSAVLTIKPRENFIGWNQKQKLNNLNKIANNYRFALKTHGVGSRVLSLLETEAKKEWKRKYGDPLVLLETFVQPPYEGTSYKAANWTYLGMTKGFAVRRAPVSLWKRAGGNRRKLWESNPKAAAKKYATWNGGQLVQAAPTKPKLIFVRPLHRYWKRELLQQ